MLPFTRRTFLALLTIGCKKPKSKRIIRKTFVFFGFEDKSLAEDFERRFRSFIQQNAESHSIIEEHVWEVKPMAIEDKPEIPDNQNCIPIEVSGNHEQMLKKILEHLGVKIAEKQS